MNANQMFDKHSLVLSCVDCRRRFNGSPDYYVSF